MRSLWFAAVIYALVPAAPVWAQQLGSQGWGQPGAWSAMTRAWGVMVTDPVYLGVTLLGVLIVSRMFHWLLLPIGAGAGGLGALVSYATIANYSTYDLRTAPFWAAAVLLGATIAFVTLSMLRLFGKQE